MLAPCKGCQDRHTLCHGQCERYKEFKKQVDDIRQKEQQYRNESLIFRRGRRSHG